MDRDPRLRNRWVVAATNASSPPKEFPDRMTEELYKLVTTGACDDSDVMYARDLYLVKEHRAAMDAFVLSKMPDEQVRDLIGVPISALEMYRQLYMDVSVFRNKLEIITFANEYGDTYGAEMVRAAVMIGPDYLLWSYGSQDIAALDNRLVVRKTMIDSFFRGLAHRGNALTSGVAREAQKWWGTAIRNAQILEEIDPRATKTAFDELRITLGKRDITHTSDQAPVPVTEILH